jgi:D-serine deaminase-like pyridoxal phosphate-dependent protein
MHLSDIETPALLIDLDRVERNVERASSYAREHGLRLMPHTKTHKSPEIGRMQLAAGAVGLTVAKSTEAEVLAEAEPPTLLVAYPVLGEAKLRRLTDVAKKTRVAVALDSLEAAQGLSAASQAAGVRFAVRVEADLGLERTGLEPGPALVELAKGVEKLPGLELEGFQFYAGHLWPKTDDFEAQYAAVAAGVARVREDFERAGLPLEVVSGGTSPTLWRSHEIAGMNEIRPGTYVYNDRSLVAAGAAGWDDCAATLLVTVVSTPRPGFAVVDGGSKTFTSDGVPYGIDGLHGRVIEAPEARLYKLNEEHGYLDVSACPRPPKIGDRLRVIPNHVCVAVNMHEKMVGVRGETVEAIWPVKARGKLY